LEPGIIGIFKLQANQKGRSGKTGTEKERAATRDLDLLWECWLPLFFFKRLNGYSSEMAHFDR
jgi:hypothetical protein